jgi:hypothetical protein
VDMKTGGNTAGGGGDKNVSKKEADVCVGVCV